MSGGEVLAFAARILEREGAIVEPSGEGAIDVLLPDALAKTLEVGEYTRLVDGVEGGEPCGYGSATLARLARLAIGGGRVAAFEAELPDCPAREPQVYTGLNVSMRILGARSERRWMLLALGRYRASADDLREGLVRAAVRIPGGGSASLPDLDSLPLRPVSGDTIPADAARAAFPQLIAELRRAAVDDLAGFREAVARRRQRDAERIRKYFQAMARDLRKRLRGRGGAPLQAKLDSLPAEEERRLSSLEADAVVRLRLELVGLAAILMPGIVAEIEIRRRKNARILEAHYDGLARKWLGIRCDGCGASVLAFGACDEAKHILCGPCWDACGSSGHRPCFRCAGKPERTLWKERIETERRGLPEREGPEPPAIAAPAAPIEPEVEAEPEPPPPPTPPPVLVRIVSKRSPAPVPPVRPKQIRKVPRSEAPGSGGDAVIELLRSARRPLMNEDIRAVTGLDAEGVRRILAPLLESGLVGRVGERRGTRYFWRGGKA